MRRPLLAPLLLGCLVLASACTASLELDRFKAAAASTSTNNPASSSIDFLFYAVSMTSHDREYFELRIVDNATNRVQTKAIYNNVIPFPEFGNDPRIPTTQFNIYLQRTIPKSGGPYRIDYWADHKIDGVYGGIAGKATDTDHAWRRRLDVDPLPEGVAFVDGRWELKFIHNTTFEDIGLDIQGNKFDFELINLSPATINVRGAAVYGPTNVDIRITSKAEDRIVGFYRQGQPQDTFAAKVTDVIDEGTLYVITAYADVDRNGRYTEGSDPSWRLEGMSTEAGLELDLDLAAPQTPIETGEIEIAPL
jgi:hypothetical protein